MEIKNYKPWVEAKPIRPLNFGWLEYKLGEEEMKYVWKCIENKQEDCKKILAGNIDSSFHLKDEDDWFFGNTITPLIHRYKKILGIWQIPFLLIKNIHIICQDGGLTIKSKMS